MIESRRNMLSQELLKFAWLSSSSFVLPLYIRCPETDTAASDFYTYTEVIDFAYNQRVPTLAYGKERLLVLPKSR